MLKPKITFMLYITLTGFNGLILAFSFLPFYYEGNQLSLERERRGLCCTHIHIKDGNLLLFSFEPPAFLINL